MGRIVILNRRYIPGEAWTNRVLAYAKGFAEQGLDVTIYYLITDKKRTPYSIDIPGVKILNLWESDGWISKKIRVISFVKNLLKFKNYIVKGDHVFFYGLHDYQFFIAKRIKKIATVFCESTEHPAVYGSQYLKEIKKIKNNINSLDALFVISMTLRDFYISIGVERDKIHIVNMFVDTNRFKGLRKTTNQKYIGYCGAVSYGKDGVNILIEAFSKFFPQHQDYQLFIIGKSVKPSELERLKKLAQSLGVSQSVVFTGAIPPEQMPQMLFNASVLALARPDNLQAQNGFPTKLGEYLATGNPVVVTSVGDIPNFIKHRVNGFLSLPNATAFAEQLIFVADNYEYAKKIGNKGKELAFNEFSYKTQAAKVISIMKS